MSPVILRGRGHAAGENGSDLGVEVDGAETAEVARHVRPIRAFVVKEDMFYLTNDQISRAVVTLSGRNTSALIQSRTMHLCGSCSRYSSRPEQGPRYSATNGLWGPHGQPREQKRIRDLHDATETSESLSSLVRNSGSLGSWSSRSSILVPERYSSMHILHFPQPQADQYRTLGHVRSISVLKFSAGQHMLVPG